MGTLKVLHLYRTYFPETQGGMQEAIRQLCLATRPFGVDNTVFTLAKNPVPTRLDLPEAHLVRAKSWIEVASCDIGARAAFHRCREAAERCDVIQVHYPWPFADVLLPYIRRRKQPLVVTYVSDIVRQSSLGRLYAPLRQRLLDQASAVVASSPNYAQSSVVLQRHPRPVTIIPHCLGDAADPDPQRVRHWRERFGERFFLFVGVLRYYKGLDFLVEAARAVPHPVVLMGEGPEGERLRQAAREAGNVHFLGHLSDEDKFALMQACTAVVFPSHLRSEAFGMTLLEGARARKPLVSCEIGSGTTWINRHEETGLVVPPADPDALAQAMNRLAQDGGLCMRLGAGAHQRWRTLFSHEVVGRAYRDLYDGLLKHPRKPLRHT